ncbi:hypothetical protein AX16_006510 [Volvariella volvacea WC 439]|nr:hypothetical protein AX16_006510 [Volvariella volvacea WC 439]
MSSGQNLNLSIENAYRVAHSQTAFSKGERRLDRALERAQEAPEGGPLGFINEFYNEHQETLKNAALNLASGIDTKAVENVISNFTESAKVVMKGLDALAQVHPFIGVAVVAFKLVVTLDMTRRENNRKIIALKAEMQDMMSVLFQLRHVRDPEEKGPDGTTIAGRMQVLMEQIAKDIHEAGSACDAYIKKSFLAKTIKSKIYEGRLAEYGAKFEAHKVTLERALTVHTAVGVDTANQKLDQQDVQLKAIQQQLEHLFTKLDTPKEREVQKFIEENGGAKACIEKEDLLNKMIAKSGDSVSAVAGTNAKRGGDDLAGARKTLLKEYNEDVDELFKRNAVLFEKKLDIQRAQLESTIRSEGDRVIETLLAGAHDKIIDQDLQSIWKEMGWKGSVKARHFVLALHDFYVDRIAQTGFATPIDGKPPQLPGPGSVTIVEPPPDDEWALAYINASHVQSIQEAIDDDGTGFISIKEVNTFARSRPAGWTLLQWLAYWAAGWHVSVSDYKNKIYVTIQQILELVDKVLSSNRRLLDEYLNQEVIARLELLLRSTQPVTENVHLDPQLHKLIQAFDAGEEERLTTNLSSVGYEIDSIETVTLVTGPGRIERYAFPIFYLLLRHHLQVMLAGCRYVLNEDELQSHTNSLYSVFDALNERMHILSALFRQSYGDVSARFGNFAFGMFQLLYGNPSLSIIDNTWYKWENQATEVNEEQSLQALIDQNAADNRKYLKYDVIDLNTLDAEDPLPTKVPHTHPLQGTWSGHLFINGESEISQGLLEIVITSVKEGEIKGKAQSYRGTLDVYGTYKDASELTLTLEYDNGDRVNCTGKCDESKGVLSGTFEEDYSYSESSDDSGSYEEEYDESSQGDADKGDEEEGQEQDEGDDEGEVGQEDDEDAEELAGDDDQGDEEDGEEEDSNETPDELTFRFTRTPAFEQRYRPTSAAYKENTARARWDFAIQATLHAVRRKRWSPKLLIERIREGRRFIELSVKDEMYTSEYTPSQPLDDNEIEEWSQLRRNMHPQSAQVWQNLAGFALHREAIWHLSYSCDGCDKELYYDRLICLVCMLPDYSDRIDLCRQCMNDDAERDNFVHKAGHSLAKFGYFVHDPQMAWVVGDARSLAERAKAAIKAQANPILGSTVSSHKSRIHCEFCKTPITTPFWICVNCSKPLLNLMPDALNEPLLLDHDTYICIDCELKRPDTSNTTHDWEDVLVRIQDTNPDPVQDFGQTALDVRIASLEAKVEQRLSALEADIKGRLTRLEELMQKIASHLLTE